MLVLEIQNIYGSHNFFCNSLNYVLFFINPLVMLVFVLWVSFFFKTYLYQRETSLGNKVSLSHFSATHVFLTPSAVLKFMGIHVKPDQGAHLC